MTTDPLRDCHIYLNTCPPSLSDSALHLAAYNGRTDKFRQLVDTHNNLYSRTKNDLHNATALTVAISRGHPAVAAICLHRLADDLATLDAHFARIGGATYASRFWLRNQVLVVTGPEDVHFARKESATLLADPAMMRTTTNGAVRKGLIMLLKPSVATDTDTDTAEVLWLTARQPGEDRQLARIVARCAPRCGLLELMQLDLWGRNDFELAARRNLAAIWHRMHSLYGRYVLTRREQLACFRLLAEHQPVDRRVQHFEELCRTWGGFEAPDAFVGVAGECPDLQTFQVLEDALKQFTGDMVLLDHMVQLAAKVQQTRMKCTMEEAIRAVIVLAHPSQPDHSVIEWTYCSADPALMWKLLRYEPDLLTKIGSARIELVFALVEQPKPEYDATLSNLISAQFVGQRHDAIMAQLFRGVCRGNLPVTAQLLWQMMKPAERQNCEEWADLLKDVLATGHFEMAILLRKLLPVEESWQMIADALQSVVVPVAVCEEMLAGNLDEWTVENVGPILCGALQNRQIEVFERVWQMAEGKFELKDVRDHQNVPILFHAIYNANLVRPADNSHADTDESLEIIDSDDDEESSAGKTTLNTGRQAPITSPSKSATISDPPLEASYWRHFERLITDGADWRHRHPDTGQSLLHVAAARNNLAAAGRLLALGLDASAVDTAGNVPMSYACSVQMIAILPAADVRHVNRHSNRTPLGEYLSGHRHLDQDPLVVAAMLAAGVDCNLPDGSGSRTPLMMCPSVEVAGQLLQAGADVNAVDDRGQTVLYGYRYDGDLELVWLLLRTSGVDLWPPAVDGDTLLQTLALRIPLQQLRQVYGELARDPEAEADVVQLLAAKMGGLCALSRLQRGADEDDLRCLPVLLEQTDPPLEEQSSWTYNEGRLLVEQGAHISQRADKTPLDWSRCARPHNIFNELEFFASAGFNADYKVETAYGGGRTALQSFGDARSQKWMHLGVAAHLIAAGADYRLRTHLQLPVLEGLAVECLYEWDEELGLRMPDVVDTFAEEAEDDRGAGDEKSNE